MAQIINVALCLGLGLSWIVEPGSRMRTDEPPKKELRGQRLAFEELLPSKYGFPISGRARGGEGLESGMRGGILGDVLRNRDPISNTQGNGDELERKWEVRLRVAAQFWLFERGYH